jgi:MFS family permease
MDESLLTCFQVGAYTLGCFFGAVATIWLGNMLGRKRTIFIGSVIMIIGAILQTASFGLAQLIVGRVVTGFGNGQLPAHPFKISRLIWHKA